MGSSSLKEELSLPQVPPTTQRTMKGRVHANVTHAAWFQERIGQHVGELEPQQLLLRATIISTWGQANLFSPSSRICTLRCHIGNVGMCLKARRVGCLCMRGPNESHDMLPYPCGRRPWDLAFAIIAKLRSWRLLALHARFLSLYRSYCFHDCFWELMMLESIPWRVGLHAESFIGVNFRIM